MIWREPTIVSHLCLFHDIIFKEQNTRLCPASAIYGVIDWWPNKMLGFEESYGFFLTNSFLRINFSSSRQIVLANIDI
jgi:hypothetical protein